MAGRSTKSKHLILKGDISKSDHLRRVVEQKISVIDKRYAKDSVQNYRHKIELGRGAWADYHHISDINKKVTIYTKKSGLHTTNINGLASGVRNFLTADREFTNFYEREEGLIKSGLVGLSVSPWLYYPVAAYYIPPIFTKPPGKYTGEMRKVIQAMIATGQYLHYEYKASRCHGVYTTARDKKWIIYISTNGVYAAKMPMQGTPQDSLTWLGYSPAGTEEPIEDWPGYKQLLPPSQMTQFYSKSILFNSCGWAFNSDGSQAVNTCYTGGYGGPYGTPSTGYLYKIAISELDNEPSSATISQVESGQYAMPFENSLKHPNNTDDSLASDMTSFQNGQLVLGSFSAPRYAFFKNDSIFVIRSKGESGNRTTSDGEIVDTLPDPKRAYNAYYGGTSPCGNPEEMETFLLGINAGGTYHVNLDNSDTRSTGTVAEGESLSPNIEGRSIRCSFSTIDEKEAMAIYYGGVTGYPMKWQQNISYTSVLGVNSTSFIIIPLHDREAVYQLQDQAESGGCAGYARDMLLGNSSITRYNCGFSGCAEILQTAHTEFRKSGDVNHDRFKDGAPINVCGVCSESINFKYQPFYVSYYGTVTAGTRRQSLRYIDGAGNNTLLWATTTSISDDEFRNMPSIFTEEIFPDSPQWMYVHRDNTQSGIAFGAKQMNASSYSQQFIIGVDSVKYPLNIIPNFTTNAFWVGDPHCVNNDCEV